MCNCIKITNDGLREKYNSYVNTTISLTGGPQMVVLATEKDDTTKRGKPITLVATYCPFCGEKYPEEIK